MKILTTLLALTTFPQTFAADPPAKSPTPPRTIRVTPVYPVYRTPVVRYPRIQRPAPPVVYDNLRIQNRIPTIRETQVYRTR